jgi:pyruvate formate lyase activating enzyme
VEFRLPLIPGYTDTDANIDQVIERLCELGKDAIHLLEYHHMGETKIDVIAGKQPKLGLARISDEEFKGVARSFEERGVEVLNRH